MRQRNRRASGTAWKEPKPTGREGTTEQRERSATGRSSGQRAEARRRRRRSTTARGERRSTRARRSFCTRQPEAMRSARTATKQRRGRTGQEGEKEDAERRTEEQREGDQRQGRRRRGQRTERRARHGGHGTGTREVNLQSYFDEVSQSWLIDDPLPLQAATARDQRSAAGGRAAARRQRARGDARRTRERCLRKWVGGFRPGGPPARRGRRGGRRGRRGGAGGGGAGGGGVKEKEKMENEK